MQFAKRFVAKFANLIVCVLSCFDRVIFKGYLPLRNENQLNSWVDYTLRIRRADFLKLLERKSTELVTHAKAFAAAAGRPYEYLAGRIRKELYIQDLIRRDRVREGLVAVLCVQETCRTVKLAYADKRPRLVFSRRPQRVLYYYHVDPQFGLMYVRVETWFPYTIQVYVNGHDWLARQMSKRGLGFGQRDNAFVQLDNPEAAQQLADRFAQLNWVKQLTGWARVVNPHIGRKGWLKDQSYYWITEQAEFASDVIFQDRPKLSHLYPRLLDHALVNFSASDILTFLGRKLTGNFLGEVLTDCKKKRLPGARVKHRMKENWIKMYDKFGLVLRVETVINSPREFRVRRTRMRNGKPTKVWCPMNKGVANLGSYQSVCRASNDRYLNALAVVEDPTPAYQQVADLTESKVHQGRRYAGFNPGRKADIHLFRAVLSGEHELRGFRNSDIRHQLHSITRDKVQDRRQANAVSRQLRRLHVRGLIAKIPRTHRWRVTERGRSLLGTIVRLHYHGLPLAV